MAKYIDYYAELGVSENATLEDIKKAYRIKAQKTHPDRGGNAEDFKKVNEAYEILKDSEKREKYDAKRNAYLEKLRQKEKEPKAQDLKETIQPEKPTQNKDINKSNDTFNNIVETYKEVRQKEKEQTIRERYKLRKNTFPNTNIKVFDNFINIIGEVGFQLSKLKKEKDEDLTRYIIRNRFNLASALVLTLVFTNNSKTIDEQPDTEPPIIEVEQADNTIIYNYHIVEEGECLSQLAEMGHISEEELKEVNGIDRNTIYAGEELIIPFSISDDLLDDYTETIEVNGTSLEELAYKYKTDIYSLKVLNGDAITEDNKVLTNELLVPNFLTIDEYNNLDNKEYTYHN